MSWEDAIKRAARDWKDAKAAERAARRHLGVAVLEARQDGASLNDLASILGISRERVRQMTGDPDDRIPMEATIEVVCPKCEAPAGLPCEGKGMVSFHMERHDRRRGIQMGEIMELLDGEAEVMALGIGSRSRARK